MIRVVLIWWGANLVLAVWLIFRSWWEDQAARRVVAEAERILVEASR